MAKKKESSGTKLLKVAAGAGLTLGGAGKVALTAKALAGVYQAFQQRRFERLWKAMIRDGVDSDELRQRIEKSLLEDGDAVGSGFVEAARAAMNAVEPALVAAIGLLARRFIMTKMPSRREYRAYLDLFESMDADEYRALRNAVSMLVAREYEVHTQLTHSMIPMNTLANWSFAENGVTLSIGSGPATMHVIEGFRRLLEARGTPSPTSSDLLIPRDVIELLSTVISVE